MKSQRTVLLLNASNLLDNLTYPYAFVQVTEIADRFNIHTIRKDLIRIPQGQWRIFIRNLLYKYKFDMILITIRNTDACDVVEYYQLAIDNNDYHQNTSQIQNVSPFYSPIITTKILMDIIRNETTLPICIGGFGFSIIPEKIMEFLKPDYGVITGPDSFFEHFEEILLKQNLSRVSNLIYFEENHLKRGPSVFFPPSYRREYTDEIIADRNAFYTRTSDMKADHVLSVPIEVVRGCSKRCIYCSEPLVVGRTLQYRNLDVIEEEIEFLGSHGLNHLHMICSEINTGDNEFFMSLADRIIRINKRRNSYEKVSWQAFYLMNLSIDEMKQLRKSGFLGGANDIVSLDDKNLNAMKNPLTSKTIIKHLKDALKIREEEFQKSGKKIPTLEERIFKKSRFRGLYPNDGFLTSLNFWFGNPASTPESIRNTIKEVDNANLYLHFDSCYMVKATRVWDYIHQKVEILKHTWSISETGLLDSYNEIFPSFAYPPDLINHFGNIKEYNAFLTLIGDTYLSCNHLFKKDWNWFLAKNIDRETFHLWWLKVIKSEVNIDDLTAVPEVLKFLKFLSKDPSMNNISLLFNPTPSRKNLLNFAAHIAMKGVLFCLEKEFIDIINYLQLPTTLFETFKLSPYKIALKFFQKHNEKAELIDTLNAMKMNNSLTKFFIEYLFYLNCIPLETKFKQFFITPKE
ncbi:MAG: hypothetical protein ACW97X_06200 [Candidatus Hodarchaeales archaeon]|jgi:hypothetical protein